MQLHLAGLDLRKIQDVVDESQQMLAGRRDLLEVGAEVLQIAVDRLLLQHLGKAENRVQRRA